MGKGEPVSILTDIVPAETRKKVYAGYATLGVAIGATQVGFTAANTDQPTWLTVTLAVYAYLGTAVGFVAASNTNVTPPEVPPEEAQDQPGL